MNWKYFEPKFEYEEEFDDIGWPWAGHKFFAYDLVANLKPKRIVELGTHYGTSLWSFSQAVKDQKINTEIFAIDTWKGEKHAGFYGEEVFETVNRIKNKFYPGLKINLVRKTFDEAVSDFEDESIDVLHIDGLHTYEAVKHDFEAWLPKVKKDGVILFHDIVVSRDDFGVHKLWSELKKDFGTFEFRHSYGLGILLKGQKEELDKIKKDLEKHYAYFIEDKKLDRIKSNIMGLVEFKEKEFQLRNAKKELKDARIELHYMRNSLRWKIPNYFYERYKNSIKGHISKRVFVFKNKIFDSLLFLENKLSFHWRIVFKKFSSLIASNRLIILAKLALKEFEINGFEGLIFATKRHFKKRKGECLGAYPVVNDYKKGLVSIGILTKDCLDLIRPCIESIEENLSQKYRVEILIGDTGSTDKKVWSFYKKARRKYKNIQVARIGKYFYSKNYNELFCNFAGGEYLVLLNNDTIVKSGWLDELVDPLKDKSIGVVGGKLLFQNETIQHAGIEIDENRNFIHKYAKEKQNFPAADFLAIVPAVTFACVALRHDVFDRFKLSENYKEEAQDSDFCFRLSDAGFRVLYNPKAVVYHFECSSRDWRRGENDRKIIQERWAEKINSYLVREKQREVFDGEGSRKAVVVIRDDGIGDLLMGIGAFFNLRKKYLNQKLILFTYERNVEMMGGFGIFDEIFPIPDNQKYSPIPIPQAKNVYNFIDMEMQFGPIFARTKEDNKINRHLVFSRRMGLAEKYEKVAMPSYEKARKNVSKIFSKLKIEMKQNFIVLNLIASNPARSWWEPYYPQLISAIEELGFVPVVVGTKDSGYFKGDKLINLIGKTKTIAEYIEVVKLGKYVISTDTSAYHIAALAGIPFLAIFTGGVTPEARLSFYSKYEVAEFPKNLSCYPCWDEGCKDLAVRWKREPCRLAIKPKEVIDKFKKLVERYPINNF